MAKPEWGSKHLCTECGARFYDMEQMPVTCPACGKKVKIARSPVAYRTTPAKPKSKSAKATGASTKDTTVEETADEDTVEDTVEVGEEENDMAEALETDVAQGD